MKLEYLDDTTDNGKYPLADPDKLIRLYDFDRAEARQLIDIIQTHIIINQEQLDLSSLAFIQLINCNLKFDVSEKDCGIRIPTSGNDFICKLTAGTFREMVGYMQAFANAESSLNGFYWLYDPGVDKVDLLFSPGGTW